MKKQFMNLINVIKNIGNVSNCTEDELMLLLPNFPKLFGNEFLFSVNWLELIKELKTSHDFENFIKGLHIVELKYREVTKNNFGFGSPSSTNRILDKFEKKEYDSSQKIKEWIRDNGGNY
jgi:hypothetical protein